MNTKPETQKSHQSAAKTKEKSTPSQVITSGDNAPGCGEGLGLVLGLHLRLSGLHLELSEGGLEFLILAGPLLLLCPGAPRLLDFRPELARRDPLARPGPPRDAAAEDGAAAHGWLLVVAGLWGRGRPGARGESEAGDGGWRWVVLLLVCGRRQKRCGVRGRNGLGGRAYL